YVTTGDTFTVPAEPLSDSVLALGLKTGKVVWSYQATPNDSYMTGCNATSQNPNCPTTNGPDYDFGSSVVLTSLPNGKEILVGGHKGGAVIALDPDRKGKLLWSEILGTKMASAKGDIVFGGAADHTAAYYALQENKGIASVDLKTGKPRWFVADGEPPADRQNRIGSAAAVTVIPGVMLNGGWDGIARLFHGRRPRTVALRHGQGVRHGQRSRGQGRLDGRPRRRRRRRHVVRRLGLHRHLERHARQRHAGLRPGVMPGRPTGVDKLVMPRGTRPVRSRFSCLTPPLPRVCNRLHAGPGYRQTTGCRRGATRADI